MKTTKWLAVAAAVVLPLIATNAQTQTPPAGPAPGTPEAAPAPVSLSPNVAEVVRLAGSGVAEDIILAYIHNSQSPFNLGAEDILNLKDVGVSSAVLTAMLNRDNELRAQAPPPGAPASDQRVYTPGTPPLQPPSVPAEAAPPVAAAPVAQAQPAGPPPVYVANAPPDVSYFYNDLSPYGSWVELEGVGWCWQPRVVVINRGWSPYCDGGHWENSDAGWYWQSEYSWGWAPFHYGRWHLHPSCGWVWMPDRVWGPAWVTWRSTGDYCGWAPLPPHAVFDARLGYSFNGVHVGVGFDFGLHADHFTFVALSDFHSHDFGHHHLPPVQVRNIYSRTTVINNYVVNNNLIVNRGLPVERVSAATHTQFQKLVVRDAPPSRGGTTSLTVSKGVIYRREPSAPVKPVNMVAQKVDQRHPIVQHTSFTSPHTDARGLRPGPAMLPGSVKAEPMQAPNLNTRNNEPNRNTLPQNSGSQRIQTGPQNAGSQNQGQNPGTRSSNLSGQKTLTPNSGTYTSPGGHPGSGQSSVPRSSGEYRTEKGTYSSGQTHTGTQYKPGQGTLPQNSRGSTSKGYQGGEGRQVSPNAHPAPSGEGKAPASEPKKTAPER